MKCFYCKTELKLQFEGQTVDIYTCPHCLRNHTERKPIVREVAKVAEVENPPQGVGRHVVRIGGEPIE